MKTGKSLGVLAAAASPAPVSAGDQALAETQTISVPPGTYASLEGGVLLSNYGKTTFPDRPAADLPFQFFDKVPNGPDQTAFSTQRSLGGYGSFTLGQEKPGADWRYTFSVWGIGKFTSQGSAFNSYF